MLLQFSDNAISLAKLQNSSNSGIDYPNILQPLYVKKGKVVGSLFDTIVQSILSFSNKLTNFTFIAKYEELLENE